MSKFALPPQLHAPFLEIVYKSHYFRPGHPTKKKKRRHNQTPAAPALNMWMQDALESSHGQGPSNVRLKRSGQLPMKSLANQIALKVISGCKCLPASGTKKNEMGVDTMVTYCGSVLFAFFIGPPAKGAGIRAAGAAAMKQCSNQDQDQEQCTCNYYKYIVLAFISWGMWGVVLEPFSWRVSSGSLFGHSLYYLWLTKSFYIRAILVFTSLTNVDAALACWPFKAARQLVWA